MPLPANPADKLRDAPIDDLVMVLFKQFWRLLKERDIQLKTAQMQTIADRVAAREPLPEGSDRIRDALAALVQESLDELDERFGLSFAESLTTDMGSIGGWETTADFLEIANHKHNAELRISAGASLLALLGDLRFSDHLFTVIDQNDEATDADAMFAMRALSHAAHVDLNSDQWRSQVEQALSQA